MNLIEQKMLDAYFEKPPLTDYLSIPTPEHRGVLGCSIERSPAWPAMQAIAMLTKEQRDADRLRRHVVRLAGEEFDVDAPERAVEVVLTVPRTLVGSTLPPVKRNAKPVRFTPREFRRKMDPLALNTDKVERDERIQQLRRAMRMILHAADWEGSLLIAPPKIADQMLYMCERLLHNVQNALKETAAQLNAATRQSMGDEIPRQQIDRLEWKQAGLRVQERHYEMMTFAFKEEHYLAVQSYENVTQRSWGAYEGIKKRAERSAREYRSKVRRRSSMSMVIENMSDAEYRQWVDNTKRYEPKLNGVDAADEDAVDMRGIDTGGWDQSDWDHHAGDDE